MLAYNNTSQRCVYLILRITYCTENLCNIGDDGLGSWKRAKGHGFRSLCSEISKSPMCNSYNPDFVPSRRNGLSCPIGNHIGNYPHRHCLFIGNNTTSYSGVKGWLTHTSLELFRRSVAAVLIHEIDITAHTRVVSPHRELRRVGSATCLSLSKNGLFGKILLCRMPS